MPKTKEKSVKVTKPRPAYTLEVSVNDTEYKGKAKDLRSALSNFVKSPDFPFSVKTRVFIKFGVGKDLRQKTYSPSIARKIFNRISFRDTALDILSRKLDQ